MSCNESCRYCLMGRLDYMRAWELQRKLAERVLSEDRDVLLLLEHPPTYTLGLRGGEANMLASREFLVRQGAAVINVDRGGDITFHGPGQLVGYPILNLAKLGGGIRKYLRSLEEVLILTLESFGVPAGRIDGYTGVWVKGEKIAAIGVKVTARRITQHGFALNVNTDLSYFNRIVPCGIRDRGVTALAGLICREIPLASVAAVLAEAFGTVFGKEMIEIAPDEILPDPQVHFFWPHSGARQTDRSQDRGTAS
ncbi:MAG: lipoyl(octanoyl) transferase LipB [Syntrophobacteraceae bacterium]